nr:type II secretion system F family protein [Bowmanella dokdonensis]
MSNKVSLADLELLTSELSILLENGVKIDKGIDIIKRTAMKPALVRLLSEVSGSLKQGSSLGDALAEQRGTFDSLYVNLVRLGEASGNLPRIFRRLSEDLKFRQSLISKVTQAVTYPLVIMLVCIASVFFVFNYIVPKLASLFEGVPDLPWYTSLMLGVGDWLLNYQMFLFLGVVLLLILGLIAWNNLELRQKLLARFFRLPGISRITLLIERIRFNAGLTMMLEAGVSVDHALKLAEGNLSHPDLKTEMSICIKKISRGGKLSESLAETSIYPAFYVALLQVGEETATLPRVFAEITQRSRDSFESFTTRITTLLEPLLILLMGGIVGSVVVVMLLSMVSINDVAF